jgi:hypothetical protein
VGAIGHACAIFTPRGFITSLFSRFSNFSNAFVEFLLSVVVIYTRDNWHSRQLHTRDQLPPRGGNHARREISSLMWNEDSDPSSLVTMTVYGTAICRHSVKI